jgi:hypothetical protein
MPTSTPQHLQDRDRRGLQRHARRISTYTERRVDDALFRPEVREAFHHLLAQGWSDELRAVHPCERIYTFWDYFRSAWARNASFRIDHLLLSPSITGNLVAADVDREVHGWEKASDLAPTRIELEIPLEAPKNVVARGNERKRPDMEAPDAFDLERFVAAQAPVFAAALNELKNGHKRTFTAWHD